MEKRLPTRAGSRKRVDTQKGYRYVTPSVRLERKEISMLNPPPPGPSSSSTSQPPAPDSQPVSASEDGARTTIVGTKGPLEEDGSSPALRAPPSRNGQSPKRATEEPATMRTPPEKRLPSPAAEDLTEKGKKHQKEPREGTKETRTQELLSQETKEEEEQKEQEQTQVTTQEQTKETNQALNPRTSSGVRTTSTTELTTKDDGSRSPSTRTKSPSEAGRQNVQVAHAPVQLETADLVEFFEEQVPVSKDSGIQIAEQSVRPETSIVMEFFDEQPVRQEGVQVVPRQMARQETADVIEFFEEQDHSLEEVTRSNLLTVPSPQHGSLQRGQRSPSPGSLHPSVGLNHLDNLIRLMEQLSNLKDENAKLKKKCNYLETTKNLLKARSELMSASDSSSASGYQSLPPSRHQEHHHHHRHHHRNGSGTRDAEGGRPRLFSAEDVQCLEISESASDSRPKRPKGQMHKRSFSTGSLEVEILDETSTTEGRIPKSKSGKSVIGAKSPKQKSKGSKWARVKKVLTGQFLYEDIGTTLKSLKELGRSAQRYSTVSSEGHEFSTSSQQRSLDSSLDADLLGSRQPCVSSASAAEASSAGRSPIAPGPGDSSSGVEELGTDIWMGPPGWWEQYEASKQGDNSNSDVSSVIEVKTMYLGSGQKDTERLLKVKTLTRRQSSPSLTTKSTEEEEDEGEDEALPVHRSSSYKEEQLGLSKDLTVGPAPTAATTTAPATSSSSKPDSKKLHRKAWGRVKDIIHVRKDSVKKRSRREKEKESSEWSQGEEVSEIDMEGLVEDQLSGDFGEGIISRSTPKTSPMVVPRQPPTSSKSFSESPPQGTDPSLSSSKASGGSDMAALLASSMSEEFAQKLQAWQELQLRKSPSFKAAGSGGGTSAEAEGPESRAGAVAADYGGGETTQELLPVSSSSTATTTSAATATAATTTTTTTIVTSTAQGEVAERGRAKGAPPSSQTAESSFSVVVDGAGVPAAEPSPTELQAPSVNVNVNVEELQRRISESFSRKLAEWERRKYRRPTTPEMEHKASARSRKEKEKEERSRSKKTREEKERERQEKAREREMQRVEKEQVKLEKEKVRIEKERLRALEKQAKLERMKGRLSQTDGETSAYGFQPTTTTTPPTQMKCSLSLPPVDTTAGGSSSPEGAASPSPSPQPSSSTSFPPPFPAPKGEQPRKGKREREGGGGGGGEGKPPPLSLQPYSVDTPEERSPVEKAASDVSYGDDSTSVTEETCTTSSNIASLERANSELLREVSKKEDEYSQLQEEVQKLNSKLDKVRQEHAAEMARFRLELETGTVSGPVQLEVGELESTVRELEEKIALMENAGDQLAESMETAAIGKWQSVEGEEVVSQQLVEMVDQMRGMLLQASTSSESPPPPSSSATGGPPSSPPAAAPPLPQQPPLSAPLAPLPTLQQLMASTGDFSQKTLALHNFEKVYSHAMKLQVQMNNLRVSQLERNKEIMLIKRQLLLQEVNNVLLQAHITRRETELYQYREARRQGVAVRRWNTFSGQGDSEARPPLLRNISLQDADDLLRPSPSSSLPLPPPSSASSSSPAAAAAAAAGARSSSKHDDIPCVTDEDASIPTAGIAKGEKKGIPSRSSTSPSTTTTTTVPEPAAEQSTDHQERHLGSTVAATTTSPAPGSQARASTNQQSTSTRTVERGEVKVTAPAVASAAATTASARPAQAMASHVSLSSPATSTEKKETTRTPSSSPAATSGTTMTTTSTTAATSGLSKVETGSPTLLAQTSAPALSAGDERTSPRTETPAEPIPERPDEGVGERFPSPPAQAASPEDDKYSQPASVMECTKSVLEAEASSPRREPSSKVSLPRSSEAVAGGVDITTKGQTPKTVRSPVLRQRYLRRQKEEREKRKDVPSSPKSSHSGESGKPPLPRQSTPHQSPSASHRSKSVGDMEGIDRDKTQAAAPLQGVIEKFEKRATVCETEDRKIEYRNKTPSPTLHLPRVGLVSRVRRLKPAAELLQESQRYRSGHSIYATRIMQRYLPGKSPQSGAGVSSAARSQDKENISDSSYVQAIARRLSRETTPVKSAGSSSASSSLSLHRGDSPGRVHSELAPNLAQKLTSSCGPSDSSRQISHSLPLKDVTNEGQRKPLTQTLRQEEGQGPTTADQTLTPLNLVTSNRTRAVVEGPLPPGSVPEGAAVLYEAKPESAISPESHKSMPALATDQPEIAENGARERAATYCVSESERPRSQQHGPDNGVESIEHISEEFLDPALLSLREKKHQKISPSSSTNSKNALCCRSSACTKSKSSSSSSSSPQQAKAAKVPSSPKTQERRAGREKMETIGVLCKQSMSFDLGVSLRAQSPEAIRQRPQSAESLRTAPEMEAGGREGSKARPSSTSSEGEATASSEEKKKSRARFLDSSWLQKPKKFFKVSK